MSALSEPVVINGVALKDNTVHVGWEMHIFNLGNVFRFLHGGDGTRAEKAAEKFLDQLLRDIRKATQRNVDKVASKVEAAKRKLGSQKPLEIRRVTATACRASQSRRRVRKT